MITELMWRNKSQRELITAINWVAKARDKHDYRPILTRLCADKGVLVCTDGRRMHISKELKCGLNDGVYRILKLGWMIWLDKQDEEKYVNWRHSFPRKEDMKSATVTTTPLSLPYRVAVALERVTAGGVFDMRYVTDALPPAKGDTTVKTVATVYGVDVIQPAIIEHELGRAVLMGRRENG